MRHTNLGSHYSTLTLTVKFICYVKKRVCLHLGSSAFKKLSNYGSVALSY